VLLKGQFYLYRTSGMRSSLQQKARPVYRPGIGLQCCFGQGVVGLWLLLLHLCMLTGKSGTNQ
jgi:hypothetical protein